MDEYELIRLIERMFGDDAELVIEMARACARDTSVAFEVIAERALRAGHESLMRFRALAMERQFGPQKKKEPFPS